MLHRVPCTAQSMKSLLGAYEKLGETKPGDVEGDISSFESQTTNPDGTAQEKYASGPTAPSFRTRARAHSFCPSPPRALSLSTSAMLIVNSLPRWQANP
jgi:hypothetical protein